MSVSDHSRKIVSPPSHGWIPCSPCLAQRHLLSERSARRAAEKAKQKEIDTAAGITRQPPGRPPEGHQWDERLADWVPRPDPPAPELPLAAITAAMTSASVSGMSASPSAPASSPQLTQASFVPGGSRPTMLASSPLGSITISKEEVQHLIQRRQMQHHLIAIADAQPEADAAPEPAPEPAAADTSSPAASAAVWRAIACLPSCSTPTSLGRSA